MRRKDTAIVANTMIVITTAWTSGPLLSFNDGIAVLHSSAARASVSMRASACIQRMSGHILSPSLKQVHITGRSDQQPFGKLKQAEEECTYWSGHQDYISSGQHPAKEPKRSHPHRHMRCPAHNRLKKCLVTQHLPKTLQLRVNVCQ